MSPYAIFPLDNQRKGITLLCKHTWLSKGVSMAAAKETQIIVRMDTQQRKELEDLAVKVHLSLSELVRVVLLHGLRCKTVKKFLMGD